MAKSQNKIKKKEVNPWFTTMLIFLAIISSIALFFIFKKVINSDKELISITLLPLILGIIFELKRLEVTWKNILTKTILAIGASLILAFIPGKKEHHYNIDFHIQYFPFVFIFMFLVFSIISFIKKKKQNKLISKLSEGILLIQSISIIYFISDLIDFTNLNVLKIIMITFGLVFCLFSFFHAFTYFKHSIFSKFTLSLWSSIIMLVFGVLFIIRVFKFNISAEYGLSTNSISIIQYFLLGTSAIYILRNVYFIFGFLPSKGESSSDYQKRRIQLKKEHIERFYDQQIPISSSLFCLIFVGGIYSLNFKLNWIPSYTMIWIVFTFFPFIIYFWEYFVLKTEKKN